MTKNERLYYDDAYARTIQARIVERIDTEDGLGVVLDQSVFYPTAGGQPNDRGQLGSARVIDVTVRAEDQVVVHWLDQWPDSADSELEATVDWARRFDHMQQHSGQHILSRAFLDLCDAGTIGFHLGESAVTIDIDAAQLTHEQTTAVEKLANRIVWENRPITARFVPKSEIASLGLSKVPDVAGERLRIVEIADFDRNACGGTHVGATGAVGLIKVLRTERNKGGTRITFACGTRAVADYGHRLGILQAVTGDLTCGIDDLGAIVAGLQSDLKQAKKSLKKQQQALLATEAAQLLDNADTVGAARVVVHVCADGTDAGAVRTLVNLLVRTPDVVAFVGLAGPNGALAFGRSDNLAGDVGSLLRKAAAVVGGRGGGGPHFAQAGSVTGNSDDVQAALSAAAAEWGATQQ